MRRKISKSGLKRRPQLLSLTCDFESCILPSACQAKDGWCMFVCHVECRAWMHLQNDMPWEASRWPKPIHHVTNQSRIEPGPTTHSTYYPGSVEWNVSHSASSNKHAPQCLQSNVLRANTLSSSTGSQIRRLAWHLAMVQVNATTTRA